MPSVGEVVCLIGFVLLMLAPSVYGLHLYVLLVLTQWRQREVRARQAKAIADFQARTPDRDWPLVTTQIPLYNELTVARRIILAVAAIEYPRGRHEIQVLDDSDDDTRRIVDETVAELLAAGHDIRVIRRPTREHFKAGALEHGLRLARGEYIAVFDADFVPQPGFLRRMIPLIVARPEAGCVQGRWGHLNADESWVTSGLSLGMNGHFAVEQPGRAWSGFLLNFNGTGGVWRRAAIEDPRVGGWSGDTITEDLDLSYRAQLAGWQVEYTMDECCPAEVPSDVDAVKTQQRRWATGSIQTARKLLPTVWRSPLTIAQKLEATIHLTSYCVSVFMLLMAGLGQLLLLGVSREVAAPFLGWTWGIVLMATLAPITAYAYSAYMLGEGLVNPLRVLRLMVLGMGLAVNNTFAVIVGLLTRGGTFVRTPKSGRVDAPSATSVLPTAAAHAVRPAASRPVYAAIRSQLYLLELVLGVFCLVQVAWLLTIRPNVGAAVFMSLYATGFLLLGWSSRPRNLVRNAELSTSSVHARSAQTSGAAAAASAPAGATVSLPAAE